MPLDVSNIVTGKSTTIIMMDILNCLTWFVGLRKYKIIILESLKKT
eukprot:UN27285